MARSIWPKASPNRVARSLKAHSVIALALGGLLYILALTGTLCVFNHDLQSWEQPAAPQMRSITPQAAALAAKTVFESEPTPTTHLYINFPQADLPRTVITTDTQAFFANADGTIAGKEHFPWTQFLLDLHYYLHLPHILGLTIVGALGAFLIAMAVSGFMAHPRIFRDAFTFRRGDGRTPLADLHNRLSVWSAPFHLSNALTGAVLGLASILAFTIAGFSFDGDTDKIFDPVFGGEPAPIEGAAPLANIKAPLDYMAQNYPDISPMYFILHDPGTNGQHSSIIGKHHDRLVFGEYYNFTAAGQYKGTVGIADGTLGQQIIGSVYNVHFGNWGGLPVKLAYCVFGLSLSIIIASGLRIYFMRRREKGTAAPKLEAAWEGVVWGTPALLSAALFSSQIRLLGDFGLVALFWLGLITIIGAALHLGKASAVTRWLKHATAFFLSASIITHTALNWSAAFSSAAWPLSLTGLIAAAFIAKTASPAPRHQDAHGQLPA